MLFMNEYEWCHITIDQTIWKTHWRRGVTGYYLGFRALSDEMRDLRRPGDIPVTDGFIKTFYYGFTFHEPRVQRHFFTDDEKFFRLR